jgi:hypothetical protein
MNQKWITVYLIMNYIYLGRYDIIRKDRNRYGGGVVLYVRDNIPFSERKDLISKDVEMVCIEINMPYKKSLLINAWYRPPNSDINFFDEYAEFLCKC